MSTIIDQLITKFHLDASGYKAGASQAMAATNKLAGQTGQLTGAISGALGPMGGIVGQLTNIGSQAMSAAGETGGLSIAVGVMAAAVVVATATYMGFIEAAKTTIPMAAHMDTLTRSFDGFLGSAEAGAQMIKFLKHEARGNPFHFEGLAETAQQITALSLDVNRFLPMVERLSGGMGHLTDQGLSDVMEIIRRIQGGQTAMALGPRGLGRFGINRNDLKKAGATFNGEAFAGTTEQAFDVVERVINSKFGKVFEKMKGGLEANISDIADAMREAQVSIGAGFAESSMGIANTFGDALREITDSGIIKNIGDTIANALVPETSLDGMTESLIEVGALMVQAAVWSRHFADGLGNAARWLASMGLINMSGLQALNSINKDDDTYGFNAAQQFRDESHLQLKANEKTKRKEVTDYQKTQHMTDEQMAGKLGLSLEQFQQLYKKKGLPEGKVPESAIKKARELGIGNSAAPTVGNLDAAASLPYLQQIADNTKKHLDLSRHAFGGGDLGRLGVSPVEMAGAGQVGGGHGGRMGAVIVGAINSEIARVLQDAMRNGLIKSRGR